MTTVGAAGCGVGCDVGGAGAGGAVGRCAVVVGIGATVRGFAVTAPAAVAPGDADFRGDSLGAGLLAAAAGFGGLAAVLAADVGAEVGGLAGLGGGDGIAGLVVAAVAFADAVRDGATARPGVASMRLGVAEPGVAGPFVPADGATFGVAAARAIAAAGDSRSCGGGGRDGSLSVGLAGDAAGGAGAGRNGKAVVVAGNADAAGAACTRRASPAPTSAAGGACCAPADPAASNAPATTPAAPMARIQRLDFMVPPTLRPKPRASAFSTRSQAMPTKRRRAECKRANR